LTKMKVCEELASYLKRKGICSDWKGEHVYNKIQHVEQKMKAAMTDMLELRLALD
jgi:hypothetical protein